MSEIEIPDPVVATDSAGDYHDMFGVTKCLGQGEGGDRANSYIAPTTSKFRSLQGDVAIWYGDIQQRPVATPLIQMVSGQSYPYAIIREGEEITVTEDRPEGTAGSPGFWVACANPVGSGHSVVQQFSWGPDSPAAMNTSLRTMCFPPRTTGMPVDPLLEGDINYTVRALRGDIGFQVAKSTGVGLTPINDMVPGSGRQQAILRPGEESVFFLDNPKARGRFLSVGSANQAGMGNSVALIMRAELSARARNHREARL